jgi:hypothetical protein
MPDFSPTDAAFEGFRFTKEKPGAVGAWAAATLIFNLASAVMGALIGGSSLVEFQQLAQAPAFDWVGFGFLLPRLLPALAITVLINLLGSAVVYASAVRTFISLDHKVSIRAGRDEGRIVLLLLTYGFIWFIVSAITGLAFGVLANVISGAVPSVVEYWDSMPVLVRNFLAGLFLLIPPSAVIVRLSLAPVIVVDHRHVVLRGRWAARLGHIWPFSLLFYLIAVFKESWISTKGHFWPLAGSLALSGGLYVIVVFVGLLVVMSLAQVLSISTHGVIGPHTLTGASETSLADLIKPAAIFGELITALMIAVLLPVACGPLVRAYQAYDAPDVV